MSTTPVTRLGHYEIRSVLGAGGMGEVYLAEDTRLGRKVAIKVLSAQAALDEHANKRLLREAKVAATLDHPNICAIHEVAEELGRIFIVMQYVEGETLDSRMRRSPLDLGESVAAAAQVADALAEAHSRGVLHRDIKPSNIIITPRGQIKVLDFGLAKFISDPEGVSSEAPTQALLTTTGAIVGTVPYMSPEQVRGETLDARSDMFSFGVVLYELVSGQQIFSRGNAAATASAILTHHPPPLARYSPDAPAELERIVRKCLEKDRERRYQTMRDLCIDLENARRDLESVQVAERSGIGNTDAIASTKETREAGWRDLLHSRRALALAALLILIGTVFGYVVWRRRNTSPAARPRIESLAVLPLRNAGGDAEDDYLSDGVTDELITKLTKLRSVRVISRSVSVRYRNSTEDAAQIGRELGVDAVIDGAVRKAGNRFRVSIHLVNASDGFELWADDSFEKTLSDLLDTERDLAEAVAARLKGQLTPQDRAVVAKSNTTNADAYDLLLRGRDYYYKSKASGVHGEGSGLMLARQMFSRAIELDPKFADAYAWLGLALYDQFASGNGSRPTLDTAIDNENKALLLDPELIIARRALINIYHSTGQTEEGLRQGKRALDTSPNDPDAVKGAALAYYRAGMMDKAIPLYRQALAADPSDAEARDQLARSYLDSRRYQEGLDVLAPVFAQGQGGEWVGMRLYEALRQYDKAIALGERLVARAANPLDFLSLGAVYEHAGQPDRARETWRRGAEQAEARVGAAENERTRIWLGHLYGHLVERARALDQVQRALALHKDDPWVLYQAAEISAALGNKSEALGYLRQAIANGWLGINYLIEAEQPGGSFFTIRDDPDYKSLHDALQKKVDELRAKY